MSWKEHRMLRVALLATFRQACSRDCPENRAPQLHRFLCTLPLPHQSLVRVSLQICGPGAPAHVGMPYAKRRAWR
jgi:hypothetical protein